MSIGLFGLLSFLGFGVGGWSYSNFLGSTVSSGYYHTCQMLAVPGLQVRLLLGGVSETVSLRPFRSFRGLVGLHF